MRAIAVLRTLRPDANRSAVRACHATTILRQYGLGAINVSRGMLSRSTISDE